MSDRYYKFGIKRVGEYPCGLPMYEYSYTHEYSYTSIPGWLWRGPLAEDVEKVRPDAVSEIEDGPYKGCKRIDYFALGIHPEFVSEGY